MSTGQKGYAPEDDDWPVSQEELAIAIKSLGGAVAADATEIAAIVHANDCDMIASLCVTQVAEIQEMFQLAQKPVTGKRASRILQGFCRVISDTD